ncbi:uncharacterized protein BDR25DRAFT_395316 [Lindgomyces ingoldianus]|uniref:Uncharacterized protein n=1 Tax=Lindgomyces ingoldianus TaxID=673940 RepID=A0ACB6QKQ2_9PLEO|nr:uncharacterized protein BDR25DRAFT_395316 [Lindgomyces ingoldianus]KAF2467153.1 hypothetical protein BDR25DRAFT_395316 [Lindgomyces ingoldianus]
MRYESTQCNEVGTVTILMNRSISGHPEPIRRPRLCPAPCCYPYFPMYLVIKSPRTPICLSGFLPHSDPFTVSGLPEMNDGFGYDRLTYEITSLRFASRSCNDIEHAVIRAAKDNHHRNCDPNASEINHLAFPVHLVGQQRYSDEQNVEEIIGEKSGRVIQWRTSAKSNPVSQSCLLITPIWTMHTFLLTINLAEPSQMNAKLSRDHLAPRFAEPNQPRLVTSKQTIIYQDLHSHARVSARYARPMARQSITLSAQFPKRKQTPPAQIFRATWAALLSLFLSSGFIFTVALTTDGKPKTGLWTSNASVFIALGATILKGSVAALLGVALYQHLWLRLSNHEGEEYGLSIKNIESLHLASRLSVGMLSRPSTALAWFTGLVCFLATSATIPALQAGVETGSRIEIMPTTVKIQHAQLDPRMAARSGAVLYPQNAMPNIKRSATIAVFGETGSQPYTQQNLTGKASFGPIDFVDVECAIVETPGVVIATRSDQWYYNFTARFEQPIPFGPNSFLEYIFASLAFNATMNNGTHFLSHACSLRPARGVCRTTISGGNGIMKDLHCTRQSWMDPIPAQIEGPATGFYGIAAAFVDVFNGEAWTTYQQGRPQQNSTFIAATARFTNRTTFILPSDLVSHVQRTIWHAPLNARPLNIPADAVGGPYDLNSTVDMIVQDERLVFITQFDYRILGIVVGVSILLGLGSLLYLVAAENSTLGRLMRDSLVHSLTIGGINGPGIPNSCMAGLETVLDVVGETRRVYGVVTQSTTSSPGHLAMRSDFGALSYEDWRCEYEPVESFFGALKEISAQTKDPSLNLIVN